jgi:serine/threonine protein phosphatase PrpC
MPQFAIDLPSTTLRLFVGSQTDVGSVRRVNEDSLIDTPPVFLVADGMGGHARGDAASQAVARVFASEFSANQPTTVEAVTSALSLANDEVRTLSENAEDGPALSGTTVTGIALVATGEKDDSAHGVGGSHEWMIFNIGDSRVYEWNGDDLTQITVDHSAVQELVEAGVISPHEAESHPDRNVITRAIGAAEWVRPDVWLVPLGTTRTFVICSDGLTKELDDDSISAIMRGADERGDADRVADLLVEAALDAGGRDNVTVVVIRAADDTL